MLSETNFVKLCVSIRRVLQVPKPSQYCVVSVEYSGMKNNHGILFSSGHLFWTPEAGYINLHIVSMKCSHYQTQSKLHTSKLTSAISQQEQQSWL